MYIAVCDDQTEELKDLTELIGAWEEDRGTPVRVKSFRSAAELLDGALDVLAEQNSGSWLPW
mgnify:CR=1 FL=1